MKTIYSFAIVILLLCHTKMVSANLFFNGYSNELIDQARKKAAEEGKILFVDFYASWCVPCQWMEKNTFSNPNVKELLQQDYIKVKIDIDNTEGYKLKNLYDIKYLPSIIIFNSEGKLIDRIEETLSPSKLIDILSKHNIQVNKTIFRYDLNTAPSLTYKGEFKSESMEKMTSEYQKHFFAKQTNKMFRIQVGVYSSYQKAEQMVASLNEITDDPISVVSEYKNGEPVFKVRLGQFETLEEAETYKTKLLSDYNLNGMVL